MKFPRLAAYAHSLLRDRVAARRAPDYIVGAEDPGGAYLLRWWLTPWRRWYRAIPKDERTRWQRIVVAIARKLPNLYLHQFCRDDDDRALHDHPSCAITFMLSGDYIEHTIAAGGIHRQRQFPTGSLRYLPTLHAHRIALSGARPCWTLFAFGPTVREWGFHCPHAGWIPWWKFTAEGRPGEIGPGCGE